MSKPTPDRRHLAGLMRAVLILGTVLVLATGVQLYVLTAHTEKYFAWTIANPLTAATIGAFYLGAAIIAVTSSTQHSWDASRVGVPGIFVFGWLTVVASFAHLSVFHVHHTSTVPRVAALGWLVLSVAVPLLLLLAYVHQHRAPGHDGPRRAPASTWYVIVCGILAVPVIVLGVWLFVQPARVGAHWPWTLTPIVAQTLAAWITAVGLLLASIVRERDWIRSRPATMGLIGVGALQLIALARYPHLADAGTGAVWIGLLVVILLLGVYGLRATLRSRA
jgi:hypothetical protein